MASYTSIMVRSEVADEIKAISEKESKTITEVVKQMLQCKDQRRGFDDDRI